MTPFDLLRRYFTATGIGQVPSRRDAVESVVSKCLQYRDAVRVNIPSLPDLREAAGWTPEARQDIDDLPSRGW